MHARLGVLALSLFFLAVSLSARPALAQGQVSINAAGTCESEADERILVEMSMATSGVFRATPLPAVVEQLRLSTGLPFMLDVKALEDASIDGDTPVTCDYTDLPLGAALRLMLRPLDLAWTIGDGALQITTPDKAANMLVARIYPVRDLVVFPVTANGRRSGPQFQQLIDVVTSTVAPTTWDEVGGPGAVQVFYPSQSLVISQTIEVHEQITGLLGALRKSSSMQETPLVAKPLRLRALRQPRRSDPVDGPRYVITPTAAWANPRVHE